MTLDPVPFAELASADLTIDRQYRGGTHKSSADDPLHRLMRVGNMGGFRYLGSLSKDDVRLVVLYTSGVESEWPDELDSYTGQFTYFGDNRTPGRMLHDTKQGGNRLLNKVFEWTHTDQDARRLVPPFFIFQRSGPGRSVRFVGLAAPGSGRVAPGDDLVAVWRSSRGSRFQNYKAVFTVLDEATISRSWIDELVSGQRMGAKCPRVWRDWVATRSYRPLITERIEVRTRQEQEPQTASGRRILSLIHHHFNNVLGSPTRFEEFAVVIWKILAPATGTVNLTRPWRDGGRDAVGQYHIGPPGDALPIEFSLEAKCYGSGSVGVRDVSRLISRLRHRQFGVFVTTSFFNGQAYKEVRGDGHPVVLVAGGDIVRALRTIGLSEVDAVQEWLKVEFPPNLSL